jgi:hypothetical protein
MRFARKTVSRVALIGVALSVFGALAAGVFLLSDLIDKAVTAKNMLKDGVVVSATPTYVGSETTKRRRGGTSTTYTVRYAFWDAQSRRYEGSFNPTEGEFNAFIDPNRPGIVRRDARVQVVYDRADPARNGAKSVYERQRSVDFAGNTVISVLIVLVAGLFITWRVYVFMKKRIVEAPETTSDVVWRRARPA